MLGLIQRTVIGKGPSHFKQFFFSGPCHHSIPTRRAARAHERRIHEYHEGIFLEIVSRSALGLASVYNLLLGPIVDAEDVSVFGCRAQGSLTDIAQRAPESEWPGLISPRHSMHAHHLLHFVWCTRPFAKIQM